MKRIHHTLPLLLGMLLLFASCGGPKSQLQEQIAALVDSFPGEVGVALISGDDTLCFQGDTHFPLFSVVKVHQALALGETLRSQQGSLADTRVVAPEALHPDTWSPMREQYPLGGRFSLATLLQYALVQSDNNACDILFEQLGGTAQVNDYIHRLGITDCGIAWTEAEQHADIERCHDNWTTPLAAARLMGWFFEHRNDDAYARFVWETMAGCETGANRIPKYIADSATCIVHKTGTGGMAPDGKVMGVNDVACVLLPDGRHFELAVFVKDAACDPAACEELMAQVAQLCLKK